MESVYHCDKCNKNYKTYRTLWKHNKQFHSENIIILPTFHQHSTNISPTKHHHSTNISPTLNERPKKTIRNICKYCNLTYSCYNSVIRHEKKCSKINNVKENHINDIISNDTDITQQILNILNKEKINKKTIDSINNLLSKINTSNNTNNGIINNNNNSNNTINNTYNIIQLGKEDLNTILSKKEKLEILNKKYCSVVKLIELAHFN
jgi:hypothetical protein